MLRLALVLFFFTSCFGVLSNKRESSVAFSPEFDYEGYLYFNDPSLFSYDSSFVTFSAQGAELLPIDLTIDTGAEFNLGLLHGTSVSSERLSLGVGGSCDGSSTNCLDLSRSWFPQADKLISLWHLDELAYTPDSIGQLVDLVGGNNATPRSSTVSDSDAKLGLRSAKFNGSSDYIEVISPIGLDFNLASVTFSFWFKSSSTLNQSILAKGGNAYNDGYQVWLDNNGAIQLTIGAGGVEADSIRITTPSYLKLNDDTWKHVAVVINEATRKIYIYVNGLAQELSIVASTCGSVISSEFDYSSCHNVSASAPASSMLIGQDSGGVLFFNGNIDEISFWSTAMTLEEIYLIYEKQKFEFGGEYRSPVLDLGTSSVWSALGWKTLVPYNKPLIGDFNKDGDLDNSDRELLSSYSGLVESTGTSGSSSLNEGLILYYKFNGEGVLSNIEDYSGNDNDATSIISTLGYGPGIDQQSISFALTGGFEFDSVSEDIDINEGSVSFWFNPYFSPILSPSDYEFVNIGDATSSRVMFKYNHIADQYEAIRDVSTTHTHVVSYNDIPIMEWTHVLMTWSVANDSFRTYVNGKLIQESTSLSSYAGATDEHKTENIPGLFDEFSIWNRPLHQKEVTSVYQRQSNTVFLQLRVCSNSDCSDQDLLDSGGWYGPGGDNKSYFSESQNVTSLFFSASCQSSLDCYDHEISTSSITSPGNPYIAFSDTLASFTSRYLQFKLQLLSDDTKSVCDNDFDDNYSELCAPIVEEVSLNERAEDLYNGELTQRYSGEITIINPNEILSYDDISSILVVADGNCSNRYQVSNDGGVTFFYFNGSSWVEAIESYDQANESSVLVYKMKLFPKGVGQLKLKVFVKSDTNYSCLISEIKVDKN